jgi:small ligand-binding sensory domain FIST
VTDKRFSAALSTHPVAAAAAGEVIGVVLEELGPSPDLCVLFTSGAHGASSEAIAGAVNTLLAPRHLIGATAQGVMAGAQEVEGTPAVSLWAARLGGATLTTVELSARQVEGRWVADELPSTIGIRGERTDANRTDANRTDATVILLADPFSFPVDAFLAETRRVHGAIPVIGGLASGGNAPGDNRLIAGSSVRRDGAVAVVIEGAGATAVVSQGCRPIGAPFTVTAAHGQLVQELGGMRALDRLMQIIDELDDHDKALAAAGLHCGVVIDDRKVDYERGDFLIRAVVGADRSTGAVAIGDSVPVGATVQFQVRDASTADEDLNLSLAEVRLRGIDETPPVPGGALVFSCNGRGLHLFGTPDHDALTVQDHLGPLALAGMFCAGEVGPVNGRNHLHGFTASIALF